MPQAKKIILSLMTLMLAVGSLLYARPPLFLLDQDRLTEIQNLVQVPGTTHYEAFQAMKARVDANDIPGVGSYERGYMAREASLLYLITGNASYLGTAYTRLQEIYSVSVPNGQAAPDEGSGLGRAQTLASFALAYNWGYDGFTQTQRDWIAQKANDGFDSYGSALGHPNIEYQSHNSNWNGVVAGAHVMSLIAMDQHVEERRRDYQRSREIIRQHISSYGDRGWTQEGNFYFGLSAEYTLPAMAAMLHIEDPYASSTFASRRMHHIIMYASAFNAKQNSLTWGVGGDTIPNAGITSSLFALIPPGEIPAYKWFFDRARGILNPAEPADKYDYHAAGTAYTLLLYPQDVVPVSPEGSYPRVMHDNRGGYILRSGWADEDETIVGLWADSTSYDRSWSQADAGQLSLISAGVKWTAGPGPATSGLENAFTQIQVNGISRVNNGSGSSLGAETSPTGGYARVDGGSKFSSLNVDHAVRHVLTDFTPSNFDIVSTLDEMRAEQPVSYGWNAFVPGKDISTGADNGVEYALITEGDAYLKIWFITPGGSFDLENGNVAFRYLEAENLDIWTVMATGRGTPPSLSGNGTGNGASVTLGGSILTLNATTGRIESSTLTDLNQLTAPSFNANPSSGPAPLDVEFTAETTSDTGETLSYFWDFGDGSSSTQTTPTHTYNADGIYNVLLEVADGAGGSDRALRRVFVGNSEPSAEIVMSQTTVLPGVPVTLDATSSSDPDNDPLTYEWDLGDGRTATGATVITSWAVEDNYTINLRVTDPAGNVNVTRDSLRVLNQPPRARFDFNSLGGFVPFSVQFDASESSDPEGGALVYRWDFDDGSPVVETTEPVVSHEFTSDGDFRVVLEVEDNAGKTDTRSETIRALGPQDIVVADPDPGDIAHGLNYRVFMGDPSVENALPRLETLTPIKSGRIGHLDFFIAERNNLYVIIYQGYLQIPETGAYAFRMRNRNGTRFFLSDTLVFETDYPHNDVYEQLIALEAGYHPYRFETAYNPEEGTYLQPNANDLTWAPPGTDLYRPIPESLLFSNVNLLEPRFIASPEDVYDGGTIMFEATMTSPDGQPLHYSWDFGDGNTATGSRVAHTYSLPSGMAHQIYSPVLTVTDESGASQLVGQQVSVSRYATLVMEPRRGVETNRYDYDKRPIARNMLEAVNHALEPGTQLNFSSQLRPDLGAAMTMDGAYQTRWVSSNPTEYLWFNFQKDGVDKRYIVTEYSLTAGGLPWTSDRDPKNWKVYGSNDPEAFDLAPDAQNSSWTLIDSVVDQSGTARIMPTIYALPNTQAYAHYLFRFENQYDGIDGRVELTELQLFSYPDADSTVNGNLPPVAALEVDTASGEAPHAVTFDATGTTDPNNDWLYYQWDFGDGHITNFQLDESTAEHRYFQPGTYTATLTVRDGNGATDVTTQTVTVAPSTSNAPPTVSVFPSATIVTAGTEMTFDASGSSDPDGDSFTVRWEFGDGRKGQGAVVAHTFDKTGLFDVLAIVEDERGRISSHTETIQVLPPNGGRPVLSFNFAERADHMSYTLGAGVVPVANWNNLNHSAAPGYFDSNGQPVVLSVTSELGQTDVEVVEELTDVMDGNERLAQIGRYSKSYGSSRGLRWIVDGVPYETYNVYAYYAGADSVNPQVIEANGVSRYVQKDGEGYPGTWTVSEAAIPEDAEDANVLLWRNLSGSTVTIEAPNSSTRPILLGFQIVDRQGADDAPPETSILAPVNGATFDSGETVTLIGQALQGADPLGDAFLQWSSDVDGALGSGASLEVSDLSFGSHTLTLTGLNEIGLSSVDSVSIEVLPSPQAPIVLTQPEDYQEFEGESVELTADFIAAPAIQGYQWYKDGVALSDSIRISGTATATLTITEAALADSGTYTLEASNSIGTTSTNPVLLTIAEVPNLSVLLDFGNSVDDPSGNWNTIAGQGVHENLIHSITGETIVGFSLENINTGGDGLNLSNASETWGARTVAPEWSVPLALSDRLWISNGDSATLRLSNLVPGQAYTIEIASSFAGGGSSGSSPGIFRMRGASGLLEGFNAHSGENLGVDAYWTTRGPNDGGDENAAEGWLIWQEVVANTEGIIDIEMESPSDRFARVSVNAVRIEESDALSQIQTVEDWRVEHFGTSENTGEAADSANPTGDGIPNLMKYALGLNPHAAANRSSLNPLQLLKNESGRHIELHIPNDKQRGDIHYQLEHSEDLANWETVAEAVGSNAFTRVSNVVIGPPERVSDRVILPLLDELPNASFYRLKISLF